MGAAPLILIIENYPDIQRVIQLALEDNGYRVQLAESGRQAARYLEQEFPALIICGWNRETCRLRWCHETNLPLVMMTGSERATRELRHLADFVLSKPFNIDDLLEVVGTFAPIAENAGEAQRP